VRRRRRQTAEQPQAEPVVDLSVLTPVLTVAARSLAAIALRVSVPRKVNDTRRIQFLQHLGLERTEIAGILGTTPQVVSTLLSRARRSRRR
jgi:hypothetical protein